MKQLQCLLILGAALAALAEWVPEMENVSMFEGDMILTPEQLEQARQGTLGFATSIGKQWPDNTVYYSYALDVQARPRAQQVIQQAIAEYHQKTCIKFKKRTNEPHYIQFYIGPGCSSYVGFNGGGKWPMPVSLAQGCWRKGIVIHELGHALGVFHEQNRPDRDKHVTINWDNIEPANKFNFYKLKENQVNSFGTEYDYRSIMHYGTTAFGIKQKNGKRLQTIVTIDKSKQTLIGNRRSLSETDVKQLNMLYRCDGTTIPTTKRPTKGTDRPITKKTTTRPPPPGCKDSHPGCSGWKSICLFHPHIAQLCKRTCNIC